MGFIHAGKLHFTVIGRDRAGNIMKVVNEEGTGFVTGSYSQVDTIITKLNEQFPGLEWEYEVMKD